MTKQGNVASVFFFTLRPALPALPALPAVPAHRCNLEASLSAPPSAEERFRRGIRVFGMACRLQGRRKIEERDGCWLSQDKTRLDAPISSISSDRGPRDRYRFHLEPRSLSCFPFPVPPFPFLSAIAATPINSARENGRNAENTGTITPARPRVDSRPAFGNV